jgi:cyclohexanecarboxyl-CoA dehydrogenase
VDFSFDEAQATVIDVVRHFAEKELLPKYMYWDRHDEFPHDPWAKMADIGLFGMRIPASLGGQDYDCLTAGLAIEQTARGDFNCCYGILNTCFAGELLGSFAREPVKRAWLPHMAAGRAIPCVCLTEPHCGSDAAAIRTQATRVGNEYVLNGEKSAVTLLMNGHFAIVFAKTDATAGAGGISAFLIPLDSAGVERRVYSDMGARGIRRGSLFLTEVRVPAENLIGTEGGAFAEVMRAFDYTRALIGLMCIGAAQITLDETIEYLRGRRAFGKPISSNQGVSFPLAEWSAKLEMARWLCYRTLWLRDRGESHTREAAMCKMLAPEFAVGAIHECLILHGHYGYTKDYPVEQRLRDVIGQQIADGTPQIQKMIVARSIFGREFV